MAQNIFAKKVFESKVNKNNKKIRAIQKKRMVF